MNIKHKKNYKSISECLDHIGQQLGRSNSTFYETKQVYVNQIVGKTRIIKADYYSHMGMNEWNWSTVFTETT